MVLLRLTIFIIVTVGVGLAIGALNTPGQWYADLAKPSFNPPSWVFAPAWTILYILIAIAGERVSRAGSGAAAPRLWAAQMVLNFAWSPIFFTLHSIVLALCVIGAMFVTIIAFVAICWRKDRIAAFLFLPYAAWVGFAFTLNAAIWILNP